MLAQKDKKSKITEGIVVIRVGNRPLGPIVLGFNEKQELIYTRDLKDPNKITDLKK